MRTARRSLLALALVLAVVVPATRVAAATTPKQWDPRLAPIADKVAELRELKFDHPVAAEFLDDAKFEKRVSIDKGKLTKSDKEDIARSQGQLRAVGLIGPDVDLVDASSSLQSSGVLAYYSPTTKKITIKGTSTDDVATRVTIAHELTHALQDQHYDLRRLEKDADKVHASTPLRTLVEGDAVRIQRAYVDSLSKSDQAAYEAERASTSADAQAEIASKGVPDSLAVFFEAPYDLGPTMLDAVVAKEGVGGIGALFAHPPTADASFLTPSTLLEHRVFPDVATPKLAKGEKRSGEPDIFGAFALYQMLSSRLDPSASLSAADAWGGDSMVTFTRKGTICLRATFLGKTQDGTKVITDALTQWAAKMPAGAAQVDGGTTRVTMTACDPGAAATEAPNQALTALGLVANRDAFFGVLLKQEVPIRAAECAADAFVRESAFAPFLTDPNAEPDPDVVSSLRGLAQQDLQRCLAESST
jgi:hypothetical protein